jgi:hypothetical protein
MSTVNYESTVRTESQKCPEVSYVVERMSFGRRLELMKSVRDAAAKLEFYEASLSDADKMNASILSAEVDKIYVRWGLREVDGLLIDGERATPETLSTSGPEDLFREALTAVKQQCGLSEAEKKT